MRGTAPASYAAHTIGATSTADEQIGPASLSIMRKYVADLGPTVAIAAMQALKAPAGISLKIEAA